MLAFITAGVCHDVGHDGFNNAFHINAMTNRAIESNDTSVQEYFHAASYFKTLQRDNCNFVHKFSPLEFKLLRKRVIGLILATDMAKHTSDLSALKTLLQNNNIVNGKNIDYFTNTEDENQKFANQQQVMEICIHTCDVSVPVRDFAEVK